MNATEVSSSFHFLDHSILRIDVSNNVVSLADDQIKDRSFDVDYEIDEGRLDGDMYVGRVILDITVNAWYDKNNKAGCQMYMRILGHFADNATVGEELFNHTLLYSGTASLYAISRGLILDMSAKIAANANFRLPFINVYSFVEARKKSDEQDTHCRQHD